MQQVRLGFLSVFLITAALLAVRICAGPIAGIISKRSTMNFAAAVVISLVALLVTGD